MDQIPNSDFIPIKPPEQKTPSNNIKKIKFLDEILSQEWLILIFQLIKIRINLFIIYNANNIKEKRATIMPKPSQTFKKLLQ